MPLILVIEDDADTRDAYAGWLELGGFTVELAGSGRDGWQLAQRSQPDAILLDLTLPDIDGRKLRDELSAHERTRSIPIFAMTGHALGADERALFSKVFLKPVDLDRVIACLHELPRRA